MQLVAEMVHASLPKLRALFGELIGRHDSRVSRLLMFCLCCCEGCGAMVVCV